MGPVADVACGVAGNRAPRIKGGSQATKGAFPWLVSIRVSGSSSGHYCGGALIHKRFVLTAAHCVRRNLPKYVAVVAGEHNLDVQQPHRQVLTVKEIIAHKNFSKPLVASLCSYVLLLREPAAHLLAGQHVGAAPQLLQHHELLQRPLNPFYSRDCNNEFIKMQQNTRVDQLTHMQGVEYILLHTQEPILYIVRKQNRYSPTQVTPLANYHIIGGQVFQTPDLGSIINSRMLSAVSNLNGAFTELQMYSHYHPSKGYWWQFRNHPDSAAAAAAAATAKETAKDTAKDKETKQKAGAGGREEPASVFQHRRVGALLEDLQTKFPYKYPSPPPQPQQATPQPGQQGTQQTTQQEGAKLEDIKTEIKTEVKTEVKTEGKSDPSPQPASQRTARPPPEKRQRTAP
ncbi:Mediator of RNA polymerase II transcription subunit 6 [Chionoecetes opilio]|uniref:Mediator of RNA polymerase II transcription subunit 6 n=1 Tax=Chionoecetes opilio TaxID=41210 RepID=A0A8J4Y968_CHIOP|nr:Mediator of RNA polymerase II transcription subunit 6 [Chionoecetes opilio]